MGKRSTLNNGLSNFQRDAQDQSAKQQTEKCTHKPLQLRLLQTNCSNRSRCIHVWVHFSVKDSCSSFNLSSSSQISSSFSVFFFLPSFSFFSRSLIAFFLSLSLKATFFFTSILLPAAS